MSDTQASGLLFVSNRGRGLCGKECRNLAKSSFWLIFRFQLCKVAPFSHYLRHVKHQLRAQLGNWGETKKKTLRQTVGSIYRSYTCQKGRQADGRTDCPDHSGKQRWERSRSGSGGASHAHMLSENTLCARRNLRKEGKQRKKGICVTVTCRHHPPRAFSAGPPRAGIMPMGTCWWPPASHCWPGPSWTSWALTTPCPACSGPRAPALSPPFSWTTLVLSPLNH